MLTTTNLTSADANTAYVFYDGAGLPESIFGDFLSIPSTSQNLAPLSYSDIGDLISGAASGNGAQFGASSWVGDETTFLDGYHHFINFTQAFKSELLAADLIISPVPQSQWAASLSGPNAIGNPGVSYAAINFYLAYPTNQTTRPQTVNDGFHLLLSQCVLHCSCIRMRLIELLFWCRAPPSPGLPLYVNEMDASQNAFATYPNYAALKETYAKYDPLR